MDSIFLAAADAPVQGRDWKEQSINLWLNIRQGMLDIPGAVLVFVRQAILGPGTATPPERMFEILEQSGMSGDAIAEATNAMTMLSIGSIANELSHPPRVREELGKQVPDSDTHLLLKNMRRYATRDRSKLRKPSRLEPRHFSTASENKILRPWSRANFARPSPRSGTGSMPLWTFSLSSRTLSRARRKRSLWEAL